ncbi:MAG: tetratricopeptide repeat protein [Myxococcales bacterium]
MTAVTLPGGRARADARSTTGNTATAGDAKALARTEVHKAQLHYKLGRFDEALAAYSRAYELFNAPALLFNIGQCHKNLKNYDRAIFFFEGYLREETKADAQKRTLAQDLIAESRAELQRQRAAEAAEAQTRRAAAAAASPPPAAASSVAAVFGAPPPPPSTSSSLLDSASSLDQPSSRSITRKWWFWTAVGVGALAVAGGVVAYLVSGQTTTVLPMGSVGTLDRR